MTSKSRLLICRFSLPTSTFKKALKVQKANSTALLQSTKDATTSQTRGEISPLPSSLKLGEGESGEGICSGRILITPGSRHMSHLIKNARNKRQDMPADHLPEHHSVVSEATLLLRTPPPREVLYSEHLPKHHPVIPEATPPTPSKTFTAISLIDSPSIQQVS